MFHRIGVKRASVDFLLSLCQHTTSIKKDTRYFSVLSRAGISMTSVDYQLEIFKLYDRTAILLEHCFALIWTKFFHKVDLTRLGLCLLETEKNILLSIVDGPEIRSQISVIGIR